MYKKTQKVMIVVACVLCMQPANAEMVVTNGRNVISDNIKPQPNPLTSFFSGLGLIGIGMWVNYKNKV